MSPNLPPKKRISRRTFVKTSTLTIASASILSKGTALATGSGSTSYPDCPIKIAADPDVTYFETGVTSWDHGMNVKAITSTTPPNGPKTTKTVTLCMAAWTDGAASPTNSAAVTVTGDIFHVSGHVACLFQGAEDHGGTTQHEINLGLAGWVKYTTASEVTEIEYQYWAVMEITEARVRANEAFIKTKIYLKREKITTKIPIILIPPGLGTPVVTTDPLEFNPASPILQNIWTWKA